MKVLFTGIPGVDLKGYLERLATFLRESSEYRRSVKIGKAEKYFLTVLAETNLLPDRIEDFSKSTQMIWALGLPRPILKKSWPVALRRLDAFKHEPSADNEDVFLCAHTVFHHQLTQEFFCPINIKTMREWHPDLVVTLIDDTENCLDRLREDEQMFGPEAYAYSGMDGFNNALSHMRTLFNWRAIEILEAERIAQDLGVKHFCIAVKHPVETVASLLYKRERPVVYISHPISEPRRKLAEGDKEAFKSFTSELAQICGRLRRAATLIEPTTIDEFRLSRIRVPTGTAEGKGADLYLPRYDHRWPIPSNSMWVRPEHEERHPLDPGSFFDGTLLDKFKKARIAGNGTSLPRELIPLEIAANLLGVLIGNITSQINARDHKLVEQCDGLVVLRPVYLGNPSQGVEEEIRYHCQLCVSGERRACGLWIYTNKEDEFAYLCREWIVGYLIIGLATGSVQGTNDRVKDEKIIKEVTSSVPYCETRAELAQELFKRLAGRGIRITGRHSEKPLEPRAERASIDARRDFITKLEAARPPYLECIEDYAQQTDGLKWVLRQGPDISLDDFLGEALQYFANDFGKTKEGGV